MTPLQLDQLISDAELAAEVAVRLGVLENDALIDALAAAKTNGLKASAPGDPAAAARGTPSVVDVAVASNLLSTLNAAMAKMFPITLDDLRRGWRPYGPLAPRYSIGTSVFFVFAISIMIACAYTTKVYEKARIIYSTTMELQEARGAEQAMRLYGMLQRNTADVKAALNTGKSEFFYEGFGKSLFDLKALYVKNISYLPIAAEVLGDLERIASPATSHPELSDDRIRLAATKAGYSSTPPAPGPAASSAVTNRLGLPTDLPAVLPSATGDVQPTVDDYLSRLDKFNRSINFLVNPLEPQDYFSNLFRLRIGISYVGLWVLPGLYGMLGAIIFHMRRLLDPRTPNHALIRMIFRVLLGGFAGIIIVWFFTPSSQKANQGEFATLSAFGLAFLVGFSTDVFFKALDRMVESLTQAIGGRGGAVRPTTP